MFARLFFARTCRSDEDQGQGKAKLQQARKLIVLPSSIEHRTSSLTLIDRNIPVRSPKDDDRHGRLVRIIHFLFLP